MKRLRSEIMRDEGGEKTCRMKRREKGEQKVGQEETPDHAERTKPGRGMVEKQLKKCHP